MANYKIYKKTMTISVDSANMTNAEWKMVELKQNEGYTIREKKPSKKKKIEGETEKDRIKNMITNESDLAQFEQILKGKGKGHGYFAAKAFAKEKGYLS